MSHSENERTQVHYSPLEYKIAMQVFKDLAPAKKRFLDYHLQIAEHHEWEWKRKESLEQIDMYLEAHYLDLGETITNMYQNIHNLCKKTYLGK